jgi:ubiquinone/menaquinone biosynthesis C-methylase UbiE
MNLGREESGMNQIPPGNPALAYDQYFVPAMFLPWASALMRHATPKPGNRVLDVACGTGIVSREVAKAVGPDGEVVGLDVNPGMLAVARSHQPSPGAKIRWQEGDARALLFQDGSFDLVLCQHGMQFVPDRAAAVREMRRVLTPSGRAVVMVLQSLSSHPVFEVLMKSVAAHLSVPLATAAIPFAMSDPEHLRSLFTAAGFGKTEIHEESITASFPGVQRFVPMAAMSSAAAIPAFAQLGEPDRAALLDQVRADVEPTLSRYRQDDLVSFPMFAHIAVASGLT